MTTHLSPAPGRPDELLRYRQPELDARFALLPAADTVDGVWRGTLMAIRSLDWLPRGVASALYRALALPLNPWRGKSFAAGHGANRWLRLPGAAFGTYRVLMTDSPVDGHPVTWLDYDVPDNPAFLRPVRGEARALGAGLLLCRMHWQGAAGLHRVLYFTLSRTG